MRRHLHLWKGFVVPAAVLLSVVAFAAYETSKAATDQAKQEFQQGNFDKAVELLKQAAEQEIADSDYAAASRALYRLGYIYDRIGEFKDARDVDELIERADAALYKAKATGKNSIMSFTELHAENHC